MSLVCPAPDCRGVLDRAACAACGAVYPCLGDWPILSPDAETRAAQAYSQLHAWARDLAQDVALLTSPGDAEPRVEKDLDRARRRLWESVGARP